MIPTDIHSKKKNQKKKISYIYSIFQTLFTSRFSHRKIASPSPPPPQYLPRIVPRIATDFEIFQKKKRILVSLFLFSQFLFPFRQQIPTLSHRSVSRRWSNFNGGGRGEGGEGSGEGAQEDRRAEEAEEGEGEEAEDEARGREVGGRIASGFTTRCVEWNNNVEAGSELHHESSKERIYQSSPGRKRVSRQVCQVCTRIYFFSRWNEISPMILFNLAVQIVVQVVVLFIFLLYIYVCVTSCSYQPELMILMIINEVYQVYSKSFGDNVSYACKF